MTVRSQTPASDAAPAAGPDDWARWLADRERWLRAVILACSGEPQAVDEILQEVALAAVEQRAPLCAAEKVSAWLYRLAVIRSIRFRRGQARHRQRLKRWAAQRRDDDRQAEDPLHWLLREERREQVRQSLARLSGRDAEILLLKYQERWSYRQIADMLEISESAVDARLHRARERLRRELAHLEPQHAGNRHAGNGKADL